MKSNIEPVIDAVNSGGERMTVVERVKAIRMGEELSQMAFAVELGLDVGKVRNWEQGRTQNMSSADIEKITLNPRFQKYALWLVTGKAAPEAGQISPDIEVERNTG